jgi:hypothetical protein
VVEDPEAAPVVRLIFQLYATGKCGFQGLADHLNRQGIKPKRGPKKENQTRPQAIIFTGDVVQDIRKNRAYVGLVRVSRWRSGQDEWTEGNRPALVDHETCEASVKGTREDLYFRLVGLLSHPISGTPQHRHLHDAPHRPAQLGGGDPP